MSHLGRKAKVWCHLQKLDKPVKEFDDTPATWVTQYTVRCAIRPRRGRELVDGQQVNEQVTHIIRLRYMPSVRIDWRLLKVGTQRVFHIDAVVNWQDKNRFLELLCIERPAVAIPVDLTEWVLTTGIWDDTNFWIDEATWVDNPV